MNTQRHTHASQNSSRDEAFAVLVHTGVKRELDAFRQNFSILLPKYRGEFVALCDGEVVDQDKNELALVERISNNYANKFVLIQEVSDEVMPESVLKITVPGS